MLALAFNFLRALLCLLYTMQPQSWPECGWLGPHLITTVSALSLGLEYLAQPLTSAGRAVSPPCSQLWIVTATTPEHGRLPLRQVEWASSSTRDATAASLHSQLLPGRTSMSPKKGMRWRGAAPARTPQISIVRAWSSAVSQTEALLRWPFAFGWFPEHWFFWLSGFIFILGGTGLTDNLTHLWLESPSRRLLTQRFPLVSL